jgi:benzoyl-CoA reductase/2-hydroxyglutaryl-CoA dehydratase subunit BcrC/BadD/HgdB
MLMKNIKPVTSSMLRKPSYLRMARLRNWIEKKDSRLKATKMVTDMTYKSALQAISGKKPSVLTTIWSPSEILYAMDIIPINAETIASALASFGLSDEYLSSAEKRFYSPETCSILRLATGALLERLFPEPSAVIAASHLCDAGAKVLSKANQIYQCEYFLLDVPSEGGEDAVSYVASQLKDMVTMLSETTGRKLVSGKIEQTIDLSNKAREYALKANALRQTIPSPMRGSEALSYLSLIGGGFGSREAVNIYKTMVDELEKRTMEDYSPFGEEKKRLLWLHIGPSFQNRLFDYLEKEQKVSIAFEEINHIFWPELDPQKPFWSVAQKLVSNTAHGPIDTYIKELHRMAELHCIDGVLHFAHWGCRWNYGRIKIVKDAFLERGIPVLSLDCDAASERNYFEGQLIGQIDSFLDMLQ